MAPPRRLFLAHTPTPIERRPTLDEIVGAKVWIKRDDATGGPEAGNKIRKLHTGGLPGLLAQGGELAGALGLRVRP